MLIWGNKGYVDHLGYVFYKCGECGHNGPCAIYQQKKKFTVYFIPTFSYASKQFLECGRCRASFEIPSARKEEFASALMSQQELSARMRESPAGRLARPVPAVPAPPDDDADEFDECCAQLLKAGLWATVLVKEAIEPITADIGVKLPRIRATAGFVAHGFALVWTGVILNAPSELIGMILDDQKSRLQSQLPALGLNWTIDEIDGAVGGVVRTFDECEGSGGDRLFHMANTILGYFVPDEFMSATKSAAMIVVIAQVMEKVQEIVGEVGQQ